MTHNAFVGILTFVNAAKKMQPDTQIAKFGYKKCAVVQRNKGFFIWCVVLSNSHDCCVDTKRLVVISVWEILFRLVLYSCSNYLVHVVIKFM